MTAHAAHWMMYLNDNTTMSEWCQNEFGTLALSVYYPRPSVPVPRKEGRMIINEVRMLLEWFWHTRPLCITIQVVCRVSHDCVGIVWKDIQMTDFLSGMGFNLSWFIALSFVDLVRFVVVALWSCGVPPMSGQIRACPFLLFPKGGHRLYLGSTCPPPPPSTWFHWGIIGRLQLRTQLPENDIKEFNIGWNLAFFTGPNSPPDNFTVAVHWCQNDLSDILVPLTHPLVGYIGFHYSSSSSTSSSVHLAI